MMKDSEKATPVGDHEGSFWMQPVAARGIFVSLFIDLVRSRLGTVCEEVAVGVFEQGAGSKLMAKRPC